MKPSPRDAAVRRLQAAIGHTFADPALLDRALTHRSFSPRHNERFEFVGDAILNYTVARMLFDAYPRLPEGRLSRLRANLVNQTVLAETAAALNIGDALLLGAGELKSGGFRRPSILADAMEAVFAAVSFDADFAAAEAVVRRLFAERVQTIDCGEKEAKDAKTRLQEALQAQRSPCPATWASWASSPPPRPPAAAPPNRKPPKPPSNGSPPNIRRRGRNTGAGSNTVEAV